MTLPIQRPGQFAVIGVNGQAGSGWINHTTTTGSSPGITGPCGEVGMCGGGDLFSNVDMDCFKKCWSDVTKNSGVGGKQFMSGIWEEDWKKYVQFSIHIKNEC